MLQMAVRVTTIAVFKPSDRFDRCDYRFVGSPGHPVFRLEKAALGYETLSRVRIADVTRESFRFPNAE
jgi:hypothetical protein